MRILLVDDDPEIRLVFTAALRKRGHQVVTAGSVASALELAQSTAPDAGVIDAMLPDGNGFSLCREIRSRFGFPTVMMTALDDEVDVVGGLEAGADDYVVKPVSPTVLDARLRAVLRRASPDRAVDSAHEVGDLLFDEGAHAISYRGTRVAFTETELRLLFFAFRHLGKALSREQFIDEVWSESPPGTARVVDTTVQRIRARLDALGVAQPELETVRGFGYRLG